MFLDTPFFRLTEWILSFTVWDLVKLLMLLVITMYAVFAWVIVRQVELMGEVMDGNINPVLKLLAFLHLIAAVGLLFLALIIL